MWGWGSKTHPPIPPRSHPSPMSLGTWHQTHKGRENSEQTPGVVTGFCKHNIRREHFTFLLNWNVLENALV